MKRPWTGVELAGGAFVTATAAGTEVAADAFRATRRCGCRVAGAIPADCLFFERVELPPSARRNPDRFLPGLLDPRLPVPIEDCLVYAEPDGDDALLAFAVRRDAYAGHLAAFEAAAGCRPERVAPLPAALWRRVVADASTVFPSQSGRDGSTSRPPREDAALTLLHLHAAANSWTLLAGTAAAHGGSLRAAVAMPPGDIAAVRRNMSILASRTGAPVARVTISGEAADPKLAEALCGALPDVPVAVVPQPRLYLSIALAADAAARDDGGFAEGDFEHPARRNRRLHRTAALLALPLLAALAFLAAAAALKVSSSRAVARFDAALGDVAARLAGRPIGRRGPGAVAAARNEFEERTSPAVARLAQRSPLDALRTIFAFAGNRSIPVASLVFDGNVLEAVGRAEAESDADALAAVLRSEGFSVESAPLPDAPGGWRIRVSNFEEAAP